MDSHAENTKRIAKNTLFLYVRMVVMMGVSLFTFRELLKQLGIDDYGTYNVVGGVVILFSFLSNAMTQSNQRFLSFYLGKGDLEEFKITFSLILNVQVIIGTIILLLAETIGLWFVNSKMNFAPESMSAVNWVYQFSIFTFLLQLMQIPFTSAIISHEKMSFFSYFSIGEALLRLGVVFALNLFVSGKLVIYTGLLTISALIVLLVYVFFCLYSFKECRYKRGFDKIRFVKLTSFSVWNMIGGMGVVGTGQGLNILYNIFCGVAVNAAMGISHQVSTAVGALVSNMQMAFNPQIVKSYAVADTPYFNTLIFRASRISFYLILIVGLPVIICAEPLILLWLGKLPNFAVSFAQLSILYCMVDSLSGALWVGVQASGKIKWYTIILTFLLLLNIPVGYVLLKLGFSPNSVLLTRVVICFIIHIVRVIYLKYISGFPAIQFLLQVTLKAILALVLCIPLPYFLFEILQSNFSYLIVILVALIEAGIIGFYIMMSKGERVFIEGKIKELVHKIRISL